MNAIKKKLYSVEFFSIFFSFLHQKTIIASMFSLVIFLFVLDSVRCRFPDSCALIASVTVQQGQQPISIGGGTSKQFSQLNILSQHQAKQRTTGATLVAQRTASGTTQVTIGLFQLMLLR